MHRERERCSAVPHAPRVEMSFMYARSHVIVSGVTPLLCLYIYLDFKN